MIAPNPQQDETEAEQVTYPGKKHGFDFSDTDPATFDAVGRVTGLFGTHLKGG